MVGARRLRRRLRPRRGPVLARGWRHGYRGSRGRRLLGCGQASKEGNREDEKDSALHLGRVHRRHCSRGIGREQRICRRPCRRSLDLTPRGAYPSREERPMTRSRRTALTLAAVLSAAALLSTAALLSATALVSLPAHAQMPTQVHVRVGKTARVTLKQAPTAVEVADRQIATAQVAGRGVAVTGVAPGRTRLTARLPGGATVGITVVVRP
ncbi:MAG: hypothetical protein D6729_08085 [Deltaproteobacteria bacterium]|nr:MAG: hypothetical protein D6729_08085 [Deltaproteobacteria bacterium]